MNVRKMKSISYCRTCFGMGDLGVQVSVRLFVRPSVSVRPSVNIYHECLVSATPLTVFYWSFWNFADVFFMVWGCACGLDIIVGLFFITFCRTCFSMGNLGVQISVRLSVRPSVIMSVCPSVNIYHGCLVSATPLTVFYWSFWNFADVFFMVWGSACGLDIIVGLLFITFSTLWT